MESRTGDKTEECKREKQTGRNEGRKEEIRKKNDTNMAVHFTRSLIIDVVSNTLYMASKDGQY
jgi:hypothetical protein